MIADTEAKLPVLKYVKGLKKLVGVTASSMPKDMQLIVNENVAFQNDCIYIVYIKTCLLLFNT